MNRVAIVTGAGRGIGAACARNLVQNGYDVVLAEQNMDTGLALEAELGAAAKFIQTDVRLESSLKTMVLQTITHFGRLDLLINNAGRNRRTPLLETTTETWLEMLTLNLSSVFWACQSAMPHLIKTSGSIVNVSSLVGLQGQPEAVAYAAAKGGIIALTKTLALDFAPHGVRINCLCPGDIHTPQYDEWLIEQPDGQAVLKAIHSRLPVGRMGTPEETAEAILFLAQNRFANGTILVLDGGKVLG